MTDRPIARGTLGAIAIAIVGSVAVTTLIRANALETVARESAPLPVATVRYQPMASYQRQAQLVGVIVAASDSQIGFEVSGTISAMSARAGNIVKRGDVLAELDTERRQAALRAAEAELTRIDAELELARLRRDRLADLQAKGLAAKQTFDEARLGELALSAARDATQARLHSARLEIEKSTLRAPFDGVVAARLAQEGAVVNAGMPVLRLVAASGYEAHIGVPTKLSDQLRPGTTYELDLGGITVEGTLRAVRADLDASTLTVGAVFALPENLPANRHPKVGASATLKLTEQINEPGGWLPLTALLEGDRGLWNILVVEEQAGQTVALREAVEVVYSLQDRVYVRGTLADGAQVVATGLQRLSPGSAVDPQPMDAR